ncbi:MAG: alpha/beta hydrolase [Myxococcaceae bacterium]
MTPANLPVEHHTVDLPSLRMHYVTRGSGPLVVMMHGFPECWWSWRHNIAAIADAGFRVVAPDMRGYGDTGKEGPYDLDTICGDVKALIEHLGEKRAHIVGHDWGGAAAWHFATFHPELTQDLAVLNCPHMLSIKKALLGGSWAQMKRSWYMFFFQIPALPEWLLTRNDAEAMERVLRASAFDKSSISSEEVRPFRDAVQKPGAAKAMVGWYRAAFRAVFQKRVFPKIEARTTLIWGMQDSALGFNDLVPGTEKWVPNLTIKQIENAGHFVQGEKPAEVNAALISHLRA